LQENNIKQRDKISLYILCELVDVIICRWQCVVCGGHRAVYRVAGTAFYLLILILLYYNAEMNVLW